MYIYVTWIAKYTYEPYVKMKQRSSDKNLAWVDVNSQ